MIIRLAVVVTVLLFYTCSSYAKEFPLGIYGAWSVKDYDIAFSIIAKKGFNIVEVYADKKNLDKCRKYNIKALASFNLTKNIVDDKNLFKEFESNMLKRVSELKDHPALFGWYIVDEPNLKKIKPEIILHLYKKLKEIDKNKPVYTYLGYPKTWDEYLDSADIIGISGYLRVGEDTRVIGKRIQAILKDLRKINLKKEIWLVLQAFDYKFKDRKSPYKSITADEFRESWNIALKEGIDGLMVYTLGSLPRGIPIEPFYLPRDRPDLWQEIDILKKEIMKINKDEKN